MAVCKRRCYHTFNAWQHPGNIRKWPRQNALWYDKIFCLIKYSNIWTKQSACKGWVKISASQWKRILHWHFLHVYQTSDKVILLVMVYSNFAPFVHLKELLLCILHILIMHCNNLHAWLYSKALGVCQHCCGNICDSWCFLDCFVVCPPVETLLWKQFLLPGKHKCFIPNSETFDVSRVGSLLQKHCFSVRPPWETWRNIGRKQCSHNNVY